MGIGSQCEGKPSADRPDGGSRDQRGSTDEVTFVQRRLRRISSCGARAQGSLDVRTLLAPTMECPTQRRCRGMAGGILPVGGRRRDAGNDGEQNDE